MVRGEHLIALILLFQMLNKQTGPGRHAECINASISLQTGLLMQRPNKMNDKYYRTIVFNEYGSMRVRAFQFKAATNDG